MDDFNVNLKCLFCGSELKAPEDSKYGEGDLITCQDCGEKNHFVSILDIAKTEAIDKVESELNQKIAKLFN